MASQLSVLLLIKMDHPWGERSGELEEGAKVNITIQINQALTFFQDFLTPLVGAVNPRNPSGSHPATQGTTLVSKMPNTIQYGICPSTWPTNKEKATSKQHQEKAVITNKKRNEKTLKIAEALILNMLSSDH